MGLAPCRECGRQVSTEAEACPHCGLPNPADVPTGKGTPEAAATTKAEGLTLGCLGCLGVGGGLVVILGVVALFVDMLASGNGGQRSEGGTALEYALLDETVDESPDKTQVTINLAVPEAASDQELTALLSQLLRDASQRTGFRYHASPTTVSIFAYASREHAESGMGQWEAMVLKTPLDPEPSVRIRSGRGTTDEDGSRFGLTRQERMAVFGQLVRAGDQGRTEAESEFPTDLTRQFERADQLTDRYKQDLADALGKL